MRQPWKSLLKKALRTFLPEFNHDKFLFIAKPGVHKSLALSETLLAFHHNRTKAYSKVTVKINCYEIPGSWRISDKLAF